MIQISSRPRLLAGLRVSKKRSNTPHSWTIRLTLETHSPVKCTTARGSVNAHALVFVIRFLSAPLFGEAVPPHTLVGVVVGRCSLAPCVSRVSRVNRPPCTIRSYVDERRISWSDNLGHTAHAFEILQIRVLG